ncbi:hypothetical protein HDV57DRAFT_466233 [Trichoderma longibrachiatum]|uniref:Uncharacterized protein n=1 Tax=Trichoderma longibrachiatum ATCC 18648 TaxID=983965 RepID=A0A2T4C5M7_TRILO|nr:hypothetical protein M440DRAFT_1236583 [Trichoderma longibrachiatum ATCC 18648]
MHRRHYTTKGTQKTKEEKIIQQHTYGYHTIRLSAITIWFSSSCFCHASTGQPTISLGKTRHIPMAKPGIMRGNQQQHMDLLIHVPKLPLIILLPALHPSFLVLILSLWARLAFTRWSLRPRGSMEAAPAGVAQRALDVGLHGGE